MVQEDDSKTVIQPQERLNKKCSSVCVFTQGFWTRRVVASRANCAPKKADLIKTVESFPNFQ